ncbi:malectin-like carbohydrate-binding domain-containing protein [Artemisia annua]|uniref:Malectin-like carbohydrate-binding domain-containing protein n=1 Tax=Artemisia annua TaxID=35608 RepID=A0A2U1PDG3_ARTAN|nr:malectin-like carbohydrate-binding domain-containing protein [Artemisia annua]
MLLLFFTTTTTAQPYKATDHFFLDCGSSTTSTTNQRWYFGDEYSKFVPIPNITTTSFSSTPDFHDSSVPNIPYSSARIFNDSSFTYMFPVSEGPKFLRLYFYPATYSGLNPDQFFFSVSSNGYSLLSNFSAFLTASYMAKIRLDAGVDGPSVPNFFKEFLINVKDSQCLNVIFTPLPNSYAFINGIEIVSLPENLHAKEPKGVNMDTVPAINKDTALENVYRLNMGGDKYAVKMIQTPNYTAPEPVYQTQRSMGNQSDVYNLTWILPVDSGFYYMLRLHFCSIIPQYTKPRQVVFTIFINNQTAEEEADLFDWTQGSGHPVFKDYVVFVTDPDGHRSKQDLWLAMHPNSNSEEYRDAFLNGLEVFKMSKDNNLALSHNSSQISSP